MKKNLLIITLIFFSGVNMKKKAWFVLVVTAFLGCSLAWANEPDFLSGKKESFKEAHKVFQTSCLPCHSATLPLSWHEKLPIMNALKKKEYRKALAGINLDETIYLPEIAPSPEALNRIESSVLSGKMPPHDYVIRNWKARLSKKEKQAILNWIQDEKQPQQEPPASAEIAIDPTPDLKPLKVTDETFEFDSEDQTKAGDLEDESYSNPFKPREF